MEFADQVDTEILLLKTYGMKLPERIVGSPVGPIDYVSNRILKLLDPTVLLDYSPLAVRADGNCLFRALSRALFNSETHHCHIRLLTVLEMAKNPSSYNTEAPDYLDLIRNTHIRPER